MFCPVSPYKVVFYQLIIIVNPMEEFLYNLSCFFLCQFTERNRLFVNSLHFLVIQRQLLTSYESTCSHDDCYQHSVVTYCISGALYWIEEQK